MALPTTPAADLGVLDLILKSGPLVKFVILLLGFLSVISWAIILAKALMIRKVQSQNAVFLKLFWGSKSLDEIFGKSDQFSTSPVAMIFRSGFKELQKLSTTGKKSDAGAQEVDNIQRALFRASASEANDLEAHLGWLATTASAAPFIGLFGTVWGIMNSFQQIGATQSANLAVVAPGISEALIATAIGLGAAIPAVVAYNYFANQIKKVANEMDCFSQDFLNIVQRGLLGTKGVT